MLKYLKFQVEFLKPTKTLSGEHAFTEGLTGIVGPNGKGKSMILEMIQFALHGTEALRGKKDGYGKIDTYLNFEINGKLYNITRTKSNAKLAQIVGTDWIPMASGTKPVDAKIQELFGYSSDVFRVANVCNQGKIEEFGEMKPSARKQLIDETIGLNVLDEMTGFIDEERKRLSNGIKAIESILVPPQEPVAPEKILQPEALKASMVDMQKLRDQRNLFSAAAARILLEPSEVKLLDIDDKLPEYQRGLQTRNELKAELNMLNRTLKAIPPAPANMVETLEPDDDKLDTYQGVLNKYNALEVEHNINQRGLAKYKWTEPVMSREEIEAYRARNVLVDRWEAKQALIKKAVPHDCPKCHHHWEDADPRIESEYGDVPNEKPQRQYTATQLDRHMEDLLAKEAATPIALHLIELKKQMDELNAPAAVARVDAIQVTRASYQNMQYERKNQAQRQELEAKIKELNSQYDLTDFQALIDAINDQRLKVQKYQYQLETYQMQLKEKVTAQAVLDTLPENLDQDIQTLEGLYVEAINYQSNLSNYQKNKKAYDQSVESLNLLRQELQDWDNGRQAVVDLRAKVKGYLLPSLNSVSSNLINQMTGGELASMAMNDQGEISVDGQPVETLSGAGKAVANLAMRIGLGQVLTNRVFSSLMLDEIDASCDSDRSKYIAGCLMNLTKIIKQVILVSHKQDLPANQYVRL